MEEICYYIKGAKESWFLLAGYILGTEEVIYSCWSGAKPAPVKGRFSAMIPSFNLRFKGR